MPILLGSERTDLCRYRPFLTLFGLILHLLVLPEGPESFVHNVRMMDKEILAAIVGGNKAESLLITEPLYSTCCHDTFSFADPFILKKSPIQPLLTS